MKILFRLLIIFLAITSAYAQAPKPKPIDIEMARKQLLSTNHISPNDFIRKLKPALFNVMYAGNLCFVHLPYKSYAGEAFMQVSDMLVYRMTDGKWVFDKLTYAWYDLKLINPDQLIFQSNVQFCDMTARCDTYQSVSHYDGATLVPLREYKGFDRKEYYKSLLDNGKLAEQKLVPGDTVLSTHELYEFRFEEHQTSYTLKRKAEAVASISKTTLKTKVILDNFQRVIINY